MAGSRCWYPFHTKVESEDSTAWFRIRHFQTTARKLSLQMYLPAEWLVLGSYDRGFLTEGVKIYEMAGMSPLDSPNIFSCLKIYSVWVETTLSTCRPMRKQDFLDFVQLTKQVVGWAITEERLTRLLNPDVRLATRENLGISSFEKLRSSCSSFKDYGTLFTTTVID